jgi:thiamine-monophosphate kinase
MLLKDIGEFALIERFKRRIKLDRSVVAGSGDDCAVIKWDKKGYLLFTCDMIVEEVDFLHNEKPELIGRKALAISISDIAACGGIPRYAVVSLGLPSDYPVSKAEKITNGIFALAREFKINIVGGDLSRADKVVIDISMLGFVEKKHLVLRSGARIDDIICVTGTLGGSILGKHLKFTPRLKEARYLVNNFKVNSMIDISDGLINDLGHIIESSGRGALLYEELIPQSRKATGLKDALSSGEDFELLFTLSRVQASRLFAAKPGCFKPIGKIVDKKFGVSLVDKDGREKVAKRAGFQHFK